MTTPEEVLGYWLDELGPKAWYAGGEELDEDVRRRFGDAWDRALDGGYSLWLTYPNGTLAYIILTDQFSRNIHRGRAEAFATDGPARAAAKMAISRNWDIRIDEPARQFFYLPLMHSENLSDQDRCVRLIKSRLPKAGADNLLHARAHREVIRRFGRFPYRNEALGRATTPAEKIFFDEGGYAALLKELRDERVG